MKYGTLSQYFEGVACKRLSAVEVSPELSNQHEFNGVAGLRRIFGEGDSEPARFPAKFFYFRDDEEPLLHDGGVVTWYDARRKGRLERGINRTEYRLYFRSNPVMDLALEGDTVLIAKLADESQRILVVVAQKESAFENQLLWLFGLSEQTPKAFVVLSESELESPRRALDIVSGLVLEQIGVDVVSNDDRYLEILLNEFGTSFPSTREFSTFARKHCGYAGLYEDPDEAVMRWMNHEERLFRTFEKYIVGDLLKGLVESGSVDVDAYIKIVQSALQRRKSRAGSALENHLEHLFQEFGLRYVRTPRTEGTSRPDFIFPSISDYFSEDFPVGSLTMLAVKSTCKDRWRQVLNEAERIEAKHLFTLEPGVSVNQTAEMTRANVQLVVPQGIFSSYKETQQKWLLSLKGFLEMLMDRQNRQ